MTRVDLHSVFAATADGEAVLELRTLGTLVHDGAIVACDPFTSRGTPFARAFPAGAHPVEVLVTKRRGDQRIALARVRFSSETPARFELATCAGQDLRALAPGQIYGYGVDAGTGCFAAAGALDHLDSNQMVRDLEAQSTLTWGWAVASRRAWGHEVVAFSSGYGDGVYASYIGLTESGDPVCLVTDFGCIDVLSLELPEIPDDPAFRRAHIDAMLPRVLADLDYEAAAELAGAGPDAAHVVVPLLDALASASDETRSIVMYVLRNLIRIDAAQRIIAPRLAELDDDTLGELLVDSKDPAWLTAARALWHREPLRPAILSMELMASRVYDPITSGHAVEVLTSNDEQLVETALRVLLDRDLETAATIAVPALERVRAVAASPPGPRAHKHALAILCKTGDDLATFLALPSPHTRLAAASAINEIHRGRGDATLVALANDGSLDLDLRFEAAGRIDDEKARVAAYLVIGLAGNVYAPVQLRYIGGPEAIAALEQLVTRAKDKAVREQATQHLKTARAILDARAEAE